MGQEVTRCPHPTDALEVDPHGLGTLCHVCGRYVNWAEDPETNSAPMWFRCTQCKGKTKMLTSTGQRRWECTVCGVSDEYPVGPHLRTVLRMEGEKNRHGTRNMYNQGCRCQECKAATAAYARGRRKAKKVLADATPEMVEHGKYSTYTNWRCRCELCCAANLEYHHARRDKRPLTRWDSASAEKARRRARKREEAEGDASGGGVLGGSES
jgi:hypothetical protein